MNYTANLRFHNYSLLTTHFVGLCLLFIQLTFNQKLNEKQWKEIVKAGL